MVINATGVSKKERKKERKKENEEKIPLDT
jgi:hypothetical protein